MSAWLLDQAILSAWDQFVGLPWDLGRGAAARAAVEPVVMVLDHEPAREEVGLEVAVESMAVQPA